MHPELKKEINVQTSVRYMRFLRTVKIDYLELSATNLAADSGRWVPAVPTHPAHLIISSLDETSNKWTIVKEAELPVNPKFAGEGLSREMTCEEMDEYFKRTFSEQVPHKIGLGGFETDCLRVECDREHPVWPNHGECNGGPYNVPFGILRPLKVFGEEKEGIFFPVYNTKLKKMKIAPSAPKGMSLNTRNPLMILFKGAKMSVGFSLIRPMLTHLSWNYFGGEIASTNRLVFKGISEELGGLNGPSFITRAGNFSAQNMTGSVAVEGNKVLYHGIQTGCGIVINAVFTVEDDRLIMELEQDSPRDIPAMEAEAWRLLWDLKKGMTGMAALPDSGTFRNGFVRMPAVVAGDGVGCLSFELKAGAARLHTESYRLYETRSTGFVLADYDGSGETLIVRKGRSAAVFEIKPCNLTPRAAHDETRLSDGILKCWADGFTAFRPELGGFSNNSISVNCHVNQYGAIDFAAFTAKPAQGPDPIELVKFSIGRALMDGGGYGYHRSLYMDSDPILISGAGRIWQLTEDRTWLGYVKPGIIMAVKRILSSLNLEEGMVVCAMLSGNSGAYRWSSNAMDVIGFGHIDAYVNAWSFRAMKNAAGLMKITGEKFLAERCEETALTISRNYARRLINPETGWIAGWKSRDGNLHDYGFVWVNGVACAFGVMDKDQTRRTLLAMEKKRQELFPESGYLGLPLNLFPIKATDHMLSKSKKYKILPSFENYTDGALSPCMVGYYLRALVSNGLSAESSKIMEELERGYLDGNFHGPYGTGKEFMMWPGMDSGYEGTFFLNSSPLYAIAVERGIITPPNPEWWPEA